MISDLGLEAIGGLGLIAELTGWFEQRSGVPRYVLGTAFVVAAILGHWIVPRIIPGL